MASREDKKIPAGSEIKSYVTNGLGTRRISPTGHVASHETKVLESLQIQMFAAFFFLLLRPMQGTADRRPRSGRGSCLVSELPIDRVEILVSSSKLDDWRHNHHLRFL